MRTEIAVRLTRVEMLEALLIKSIDKAREQGVSIQKGSIQDCDICDSAGLPLMLPNEACVVTLFFKPEDEAKKDEQAT